MKVKNKYLNRTYWLYIFYTIHNSSSYKKIDISTKTSLSNSFLENISCPVGVWK